MENQRNSSSLPERKEIRLKGWDYADSACYHVVICTSERACTLGQIVDVPSSHVELSPLGELCEKCMCKTLESMADIIMVVYVIMPNHVHMLVRVAGEGDTSLGAFVRSFKARVTRGARAALAQEKVWQRGYYEHIIRDESDFAATWEYIENNPAKWAEDQYYR